MPDPCGKHPCVGSMFLGPLRLCRGEAPRNMLEPSCQALPQAILHLFRLHTCCLLLQAKPLQCLQSSSSWGGTATWSTACAEDMDLLHIFNFTS